MRQPFIIFFLFAYVMLIGCKSSKTHQTHTDGLQNKTMPQKIADKAEQPNTPTFHDTHTEHLTESPKKAVNIVDYAKQFEGVSYKFGGTTKQGMDCSGLVYTSYKAYDIDLPRISRNMAKEGEPIPLEYVEAGDLLFFKTNGKHNPISHVGMVVTALPGNIEFIHATTSQGVVISSLAERYWYFSFVEARRVL